MPRVIITIRDEHYRGVKIILRSDKGISSVLNALRGAVSVEDDDSYETPPRITLGSEVSVAVKTLSSKTRFCVRAGEVTVDVSDPETRAPKRTALRGTARFALDRQRTFALEDRR
jgi:hypothetical protein